MLDHIRQLLNRVNNLGNTTRQIISAVVGAGILAGLIRLLLEFSSRVHWTFGAALAAAFTGLAVWLTYQVKRSSQYNAPHEVVAVLALGLFTLSVVGAWISFTLYVSGLGCYVVPAKYSITTFIDLYMYTFFNLLPGIEVWKTLGLEPPIESRGVVAGLPLLGFKVFVVWLLLNAYRSWRKGTKEARVRE